MNSLFLYDQLTLAFWSPGPAEMMVLAVVALLLYGGNLPEVARSWGKSFAEFRRGLTGFQSELNSVIYSEPEQIEYQDDNYRDDAHYANGYEESDPNQEDASQDADSEDSQDSQDSQGKSDESKKTINVVGTETMVIEDAEEDAEEKPTD